MIKSKYTLVTVLVLVAVVILGSAGAAWKYHKISQPTVVFDRMLETMLTTSSVTKRISQEEGGQKLDQIVQLTTSPQGQVHSQNILDQGAATITTESIGTPNKDYIRYKAIATDQKNAAGKAFDFTNVLSFWGQSGGDQESSAQLYNQTLLGAVPVARLQPDARQKLINQIRNDGVYNVDYANVKRSKTNGRPTHSYQVTVKPVPYINMLKTFVSLIGSDQLQDVDANLYTDTEELVFSFDIDVWSGQLTKVSYVGTSRVETYSAYGAFVLVEEPAEAIGLDELQSRLESIQ